MGNKKKLVYFGAAGAGLAYCEHSKILPDFFVDNDPSKWGTSIKGVEIVSPEILISTSLQEIVITSGYIKDIYSQVLSLGVDKSCIRIPPKALLGIHPFIEEESRIQAASKLHDIMALFSDSWSVVAVGGTALGFCRGGDFIYWDFDIDLFAPIQLKRTLHDLLKNSGYEPKDEGESITATLVLENGATIPFSVDFFDADSEFFIDRYEDYSWKWPTKMFSQYTQVEVHGKLMNVPNPPGKYLSEVYGSTWAEPNPDFGYSDYAGNKA